MADFETRLSAQVDLAYSDGDAATALGIAQSAVCRSNIKGSVGGPCT